MKRKASLTVNRMTTHPCPGCGAHLEGATGVKIGSEAGEMPPAPVPKEGDITICCYCGALLKYGPSLSVLKTSEEEERQVLATPIHRGSSALETGFGRTEGRGAQLKHLLRSYGIPEDASRNSEHFCRPWFNRPFLLDNWACSPDLH